MMAATREQIVTLARTCRGTPFRHQGRVPQRGLDCVGLLIYLSNTLELGAHYENTAYARFPSQASVQYELGEQLERVAIADAKHGDVVLVADDGNHSCHVGILATDTHGATLIHAAARDGAVVEEHIDRAMRRKVRAIFRFRRINEVIL